ncbi:putative nuclease HARBI1 [Macrobrachium nipponense]|uniref:putative nuclease HARBI1 n=1 Tax=Macrobrachium nipponense TaxID=159736 RepID=UPI0030C82ACB
MPQPPAPSRKDGRAWLIWAREWLTRRQLHGDYNQLLQELNKEDFCQAIIDTYRPEVMKCPKTQEEWKNVAKRFASKWNYFNCVGALDGKHVAIKKRKGGGSLYFNYKKFHSIILMALSDAKYKLLFIDVGAGGAGDGGTWQKCNLARTVTNNRTGLPQYRNLPNDEEPIPFHIVADDAFALNPWLMKPYSHQSQDPTKRMYSYRLSRARRVVENAFGLLQMRWRVFGTTMQHDVQVCKKITLCSCVMRNLALQRYPLAGTDVDYEDQHHNVVAVLGGRSR